MVMFGSSLFYFKTPRIDNLKLRLGIKYKSLLQLTLTTSWLVLACKVSVVVGKRNMLNAYFLSLTMLR